MLDACLNYINNNHSEEIIPDKVEEQRMKVAEWLVIMRNNCARNGLNDPDPEVRKRMSDELIVCNLEWSYEEDCLVHKNGLKRKFSASDAEHSLYALYVLLVSVRPERNMSVKSKIDGPKYAPLRLPPGKGIAKDLDLISPLLDTYKEVKGSYMNLINDIYYELMELYSGTMNR